MRKRKLKVYEKKPFKTIVYLVLRFLVIIAMIRQFMQGNFSGVFLCIITLFLFLIPTILDKKFNIELPDTLEVIVYLFIFSTEILGEINAFYVHFAHWDTMMHTLNGFLMAAIGFALIDILNSSDKVHIYLTPFFVSLVACCFSMTVGVMWEFIEYGADQLTNADMQKDTIITHISSVKFAENGKNKAVNIPIDSLKVNDEDWIEKYGGYIDVGLHDTMKDLMVNFLGAIIFSCIGWFYLQGRSDAALKFMPKKKVIVNDQQSPQKD